MACSAIPEFRIQQVCTISDERSYWGICDASANPFFSEACPLFSACQNTSAILHYVSARENENDTTRCLSLTAQSTFWGVCSAHWLRPNKTEASQKCLFFFFFSRWHTANDRIPFLVRPVQRLHVNRICIYRFDSLQLCDICVSSATTSDKGCDVLVKSILLDYRNDVTSCCLRVRDDSWLTSFFFFFILVHVMLVYLFR